DVHVTGVQTCALPIFARCQMVLGSALKQLGDRDSCVAELKAAGSTFKLLSAAPYLLKVTDLLRMPETTDGQASGLLTTREVQVQIGRASGRERESEAT